VSDITIGQFKTPSLRGVADLAFFGHAGAPALAAVTEAYGGGHATAHAAGDREPWLMSFGETAQWGLVPFLETLTLGTRTEPRAGGR
jgi:cytochrome c peroxidase